MPPSARQHVYGVPLEANAPEGGGVPEEPPTKNQGNSPPEVPLFSFSKSTKNGQRGKWRIVDFTYRPLAPQGGSGLRWSKNKKISKFDVDRFVY